MGSIHHLMVVGGVGGGDAGGAGGGTGLEQILIVCKHSNNAVK